MEKARCDWLQLRDCNTNFFHSRTIQMRKFNRITTLRVDNVSDEEIKKALFDINPLKASRSNGFHTHFFQSQWDIVGNAVCEWVQGVFDGNNIDPELNNTLTPEKDSLEKFS
ncbi:hypothetical protein V6Z11_A01G107100 [Gossypium hirsutum]